MKNPERSVLFVVNHAAFFVSHRLPLAVAARSRGFATHLLTGQAGSKTMEAGAAEKLAEAGVQHFRVSFTSAGVNPLRELAALFSMFRHVRRLSPSLMHCASPKGLLYGGLIARLCGVRALVLAVSGMGFLHTETGIPSLKRRVIAAIYRKLAGFAYGHPNMRVIVQNRDDFESLIASGLAPRAAVRLIPGSGVVLDDYVHQPVSAKENIVLFPARMLYDKGLQEFVDAVRRVRQRFPDWRFVLAGAADYNNPSSAPETQLREWVDEGTVEWLGHVSDMRPLFARAGLVCLPSYREGMPKALLEAAAAGCAVITTDATGCREAVLAGESGLLVPVRAVDELAEALASLCGDATLRQRFGERGRQLAIERFGIDAVVAQTMNIYQELLENV